MERMDHIVRRINGLQEAFKTGDAKHSNVQVTAFNTQRFSTKADDES